MQRFVSVNRALNSASGSVCDGQQWCKLLNESDFTFGFMQFGVERKADFGVAHAFQLALIALCTSQLMDDLLQGIVSARTYCGRLNGDQMMDGEYVCHLNVQRRFGASIEVIELINVELRLSVGYIQYCSIMLVESVFEQKVHLQLLQISPRRWIESPT